MKVLVTGVKGQLGYDICKHLDILHIENYGIDRDEADITNELQIKKVIKEYHPTHVIHCAAYTAVDRAEDDVELCRAINVNGTRYITEACKEIGATLFYYSTDYVFSGTGEHFFKEEDECAPTNIYGITKREGELEALKWSKTFVLRISWVYGYNGNNFVKTMLKLAETRSEISVVSDQIGSPTYTDDVAMATMKFLNSSLYGIYHMTNEGICSWYEFAKEIFRLKKIDIQVNPIKTSEYPTKASRPLNSRLSKDKLKENGFKKLPQWEDALSRYIDVLDRI